MARVSVVETYSCGNSEKDDVTATLYSNGDLIVRGTGDMKNYSSELPGWFPKRKRIKSVVIMKGIRKIGNSAFAQLPKLSQVAIFDTVEEIGRFAFAGCSSLNKVVIPEGSDHEDAFDPHVEVENALPVEVYTDVGANKKDKVWATLYSNGHLIVDGCNGGIKSFSSLARRPWQHRIGQIYFITIRSGVSSIGSLSFKNMPYLRSVEIEDVKKIGRCAFEACKRLIDVKMNDTVEEIGNRAFQNTQLISFVVPRKVKVLAPRVLSRNSSLTEVFLHEDVETIRDFSFYESVNLETVNIPSKNNLKTIERYAFCGCKKLTDSFLNQPLENLEVIGYGAFLNCETMSNIRIQTLSNLKITSHAFGGNSLFSVILPQKVELDEGVFGGASEIIRLDVSASKKYSAMSDAELEKLVGAKIKRFTFAR